MNNIIVYFVILYSLDAGMGYCAYVARHFQGALAKKIYQMEILAVFTVFAASVYLLSQSVSVCYLGRALFLCLSDFLVISLYHYAGIYTELVRSRKWVRNLLYGFACLDGISAFINIKTHHLFHLEPMESYNVLTFYKIQGASAFYILHFVFFYLVLASAMALLMVKVTKVPKFYRTKYEMILWAFGVAVLCNVVCWPLNLTLDYSLWSYCIMGTAICYFSLVFLPKGLVEKTLSTVIQDLNSGIVCYDLDGNCIFLNELAKEIYQVKSAEGIGVQRLYEECFKNSKKITDDYIEWEETRQKNGETYTYSFHFQYFEDENDEKLGSYVTIQDRTDEINAYRREHHRATHDSLTELYNRDFFFTIVTNVLLMDRKHDYSLVCTDIKDFKLVNDLFGIEKGNEVLCKEADILRTMSSDHFYYGRLMGDKFAFLLRTSELDEEKIIRSLSEIRTVFDGTDFHLHLYVGVYHITDRDEAPSIMCDKAALAIETLQGDYSRMIAYYDEELMEKTMQDKRLVNEFDKAINNDEFVIYVQPQCDANEKVKGGEALVRWNHPELGLMAPGKFIEVYEKTGLIYQLDRHVWEKAAKLLRKWKNEGKEDYYISVNISPLDFYYTDIYKTISMLVEKYDINPANYKLEITETAIMSEVNKNLRVLNRLKKYGFQIEMDDFGSGYSSLNTLKDIPADVLKVDMGFLRKTVNVERSRRILKCIIELAHDLGMTVVCEGVEEKEHVDFLKALGCEIFQGYYFAKPMSVEEFEEKYM